jgi:Domain of unknown function (DUF3883)
LSVQGSCRGEIKGGVMIDIDKLRIKQTEFEGKRQESKSHFLELEKERRNFIKRFTLKKIKSMSVQEYVIGLNRSGISFCYLIENKLQGLGDIRGPNAFKFGIYFGKTKSDAELRYRPTSKFGEDPVEAFGNVRTAILQLLDNAEREDLDGIRNNQLSPTFKGKILSTYFPKKYLNIFADEHLEHFLDKLDISYSESDDEISKRKILIDFKKNDSVMSKWSIFEFSKFLYEAFGKPLKKEDVPKELKEYLESRKDYPKMKDVKAEFINLEITPDNVRNSQKGIKQKKKLIDFDKESKSRKILGNHGEEIVFNLEKARLIRAMKKELAGKVEWVSKKDDSLGYDIKSFEENGRKKFIEVKSTGKAPDSKANFLISSNQYSIAKSTENYYFYIVFNAKSKNPKVWKIKKPLQYENNGLILTPVSYRVTVNISEKIKG